MLFVKTGLEMMFHGLILFPAKIVRQRSFQITSLSFLIFRHRSRLISVLSLPVRPPYLSEKHSCLDFYDIFRFRCPVPCLFDRPVCRVFDDGCQHVSDFPATEKHVVRFVFKRYDRSAERNRKRSSADRNVSPGRTFLQQERAQ